MKRLWKWTKRIALCLILLMAALLAPVAYVETACRQATAPQRYVSILPAKDHRPVTRTFMTYPEWHIVHAYEDYAEVIRNGDPHQFGYLSSILGFWSSLCTLSETSSAYGEIDGPTKQMIHVIGISFSAELALKALYEETIGRLFAGLRGAGHTPTDKLSSEHASNYAEFLQQVPWYKWRFREDAEELDTVNSDSLRDRERRFALGLEYKAKAAYADIIAQAVASAGADQLTLRMIVAGNNRTKLESYDNVEIIETIDEGVIIETPRYRALTKILQIMSNDGLNFVEIAGNNDILFTVISESAVLGRSVASMQRQGFNDYRHLMVVKVTELAEQLRQLKQSGITLEHIHDY